MLKALSIIVTVVATSFYFFPFEFSFLPGVNTKMALAAVGLLVLGVSLARGHSFSTDKDFLNLSVWAMVVSLFGFAAVTLNGTPDYTYATYIMSMWVWLGGAYVVTRLIKVVHGELSVRLVCHYLIGVCVAQCLVAFAMGQYAPLKDFVDGFLESEGFMGKVEDRLYGIGASLDVAGMRFAAVLVMIAYWSVRREGGGSVFASVCYATAFLIIATIGCMIGRTAILGVALALCIWAVVWLRRKVEGRMAEIRVFPIVLAVVLAVFLPAVVFLYHTSPSVHGNIRFAFEGFFSLWEQGEWRVHSNEILKNMYVLPDNWKTWLIGDGYFDNPYETDPYYTGPRWGGFYMATDVGYLRFIFYFGVPGLLAFMGFMGKATQCCARRFVDCRFLFVLMLLINYIVWLKVASDLFLIFALFLCIGANEACGAENGGEERV